jgi:hypothetical protein
MLLPPSSKFKEHRTPFAQRTSPVGLFSCEKIAVCPHVNDTKHSIPKSRLINRVELCDVRLGNPLLLVVAVEDGGTILSALVRTLPVQFGKVDALISSALLSAASRLGCADVDGSSGEPVLVSLVWALHTPSSMFSACHEQFAPCAQAHTRKPQTSGGKTSSTLSGSDADCECSYVPIHSLINGSFSAVCDNNHRSRFCRARSIFHVPNRRMRPVANSDQLFKRPQEPDLRIISARLVISVTVFASGLI